MYVCIMTLHLNLKDALNSTVQNTVMRRIYIVTLKSESAILTFTYRHLGLGKSGAAHAV